MNIDELALELAEKALNKGFDAEAYIVKYIAQQNLNNKDLVPGSNVDECIELMLNLFVTYYNNKSVTTLKPLLTILQQIISEMYHDCTNTEKQLFNNFIFNIHKMV